MSLPSSPSGTQSDTPAMAFTLTDGVVDGRFFSTKKISILLDDTNYLLWHHALASWLLSSVSQAVLPHLIGMDTSTQIWNAIVNLYGSKTTSRLMFYRRTLHS
ncbi:hypothetical protein J1N35_014607 [Gossypium stocksii]|uniref:Retrotransposon Copia-like N-terminal domain-containing protein n=1 Tax=Gossypium stocksii TaxID=47602 RepID=A0A9D4A9X6_9ROSI|nr:hypothetical protein J1N35_014607 [Gossypium stocksii]